MCTMWKMRRFLIFLVISSSVISLNVNAENKKVEEITVETEKEEDIIIRNYKNKKKVKKLSKKAKGRVKDVIAIAKTQKGYRAFVSGQKKYSYFGDRWKPGKRVNYTDGTKTEDGNWCSEFVWWCLVKAKVLKGKEHLCSVKRYKSYFKNRMYKFKDSAECGKKIHFSGRTKIEQCKLVNDWFDGIREKGILTLKQLKKGDILQICSNKKKFKNQPHHTAIFYKLVGNKIVVIEGNMKSGNKRSSVRIGKYKPCEVIAVIRPKYRK